MSTTEITEIETRIKDIEMAAFGMGVPVNAGQALIIERLRKELEAAR